MIIVAAVTAGIFILTGCSQPLNSGDPQIDAAGEIGEQTNFARKHLSDRGISSEELGYEASTADDVTGEQTNFARKHLSDRDISSESVQIGQDIAEADIGAESNRARDYAYERGLCEQRHGDNCDGEAKTGEAGRDGSDGAAGSNGTDGLRGSTGSQGSEGIRGSTGAAGDQGEQGVSGGDGQQGEAGPSGADGHQGATGPIGPPGVAAADCQIARTFVKIDGNSGNCQYSYKIQCSEVGSSFEIKKHSELCDEGDEGDEED
tara:strand:+ start:2095 stop:2880 length:786 start_codon:yes stop_codon:yes gene_type:complete